MSRIGKKNFTYQCNAARCNQKHYEPFKVLVFHKAFHLVTNPDPNHVTSCLIKLRAAAVYRRKTAVDFVFPNVQRTTTHSS